MFRGPAPRQARGERITWRGSKSGLSLVEILVATGLLVAVLVPVMFVFQQSTRTTEVSLDEIVATNLASEISEQMKVLPSALDFRAIPQSPVPNPPPQFPNWHDLPVFGIALGEADPNVPPLGQPPLDSQGWTQFGYNHWDPPPDVIQIQERCRLWLSPLPKGYKRKLKLYHPLYDSTGILDINLLQLMVHIEWERTFLGSPTQLRAADYGTLISNPNFNP